MTVVIGVGDLIRERYEIKARLGSGAQGTVWQAFDHQHHRDVALKVRAVGGADDREALLAEARTLLTLRPHAGLPLVREDFFDGDNYCLVMDWVAGPSLAQVIDAQGDPGLAPTVAVGYLQQLAEAIDHLHSHHPPVVHGDVKPANAVLGPEGRIVLVDFGLSQMNGPAGTVGYVSPEVVAGERATAAADIYGLAATAVTLLTGRAPVEGRPTWEGLDPMVVGALERGVRRGLAVDPDRRPSSASELVERLTGALSGALPEGVLTFCLTDIEGSATLWDEHPPRHGGGLGQCRGDGGRTGGDARGSPNQGAAARGTPRCRCSRTPPPPPGPPWVCKRPWRSTSGPMASSSASGWHCTRGKPSSGRVTTSGRR